MKLLVTTWRHCIPIKVLLDSVEIGSVYDIGGQSYYVTKVGRLFAYCVKYAH